MECMVCKIRSAMNSCAECRTLLCEECGAACDECGKRVCPTHVHESRSGRVLCVGCYKVYTDRRRHHDHDRDREEEEVYLSPAAVAAVDAEERRVRLSRSSAPVRPWVASLYLALAGAAAIGVLLLFPELRRINVGGGQAITTAYLVLVLPFLAVAWAALGLLTRMTPDPKYLNLIGLVVAAATVGLSFYAVRPAKVARAVAEDRPGKIEAESTAIFATGPISEEDREKLSTEELEKLRGNMLEPFSEENRPYTPKDKPINLKEVAPVPSRR